MKPVATKPAAMRPVATKPAAMSAGPGPVGGPAEVIIGLDVGTTAAKAVVFGVGSRRRRHAIREYPLLQPEPGWQVQDPRSIATAVLDVLTECAAATEGAHVVALSVSTAMHGLIGLDADRRALTPLLTWADARSRDQARSLRESGQARDVYRRSGTPVHPMTPLTKLMWFARNHPELTARARWWVGLKDFVLVTLTGTLATELSSASGTGMLDLRTGDWDPEAIDLAGITRSQLPPVLPTTTALALGPGPAGRTGLPVGLPVAVGAGDGPLGNLGAGAIDPGVVGLSLGTSGAARMMVPGPLLDPDGRLFCYALTDRHWVVGGAVSNGGVVVRWAGGVFGLDLAAAVGGPPDAELLALAEAVPPGSDGLVMLPFLLAERGALWDPVLAAGFLGIRHSHTRAHFVRAAVEGVVLQLSMIVDRLDRLTPVTSVHATGGVFRSPLWRRVTASVLGRPITVTGGAEGSALGAAALGLYALGRCVDLASALALLGAGSGPGAGNADGSPTQAERLDPERLDPERLDPEPPDPEEVDVYARVRAGVPALLSAYDDVARLFDSSDNGPAGL